MTWVEQSRCLCFRRATVVATHAIPQTRAADVKPLMLDLLVQESPKHSNQISIAVGGVSNNEAPISSSKVSRSLETLVEAYNLMRENERFNM